jgi:hypothetical protein
VLPGWPRRALRAVLPICAITAPGKITVHNGTERHPKDASAASALDGDLRRLKAEALGGWPFLRGRECGVAAASQRRAVSGGSVRAAACRAPQGAS